MKSYYNFLFIFFFCGALFLSLSNLSFAQNQALKKIKAPISSKTNSKGAQSVNNLEKLVPQLMKDGEVTGLSVALIRNGKVFWHRGFGVKNAETKEPVDDSTVFEAASLSKPVFAYAVLKLAEEGKLDLDAPLNKYLPAGSSYVENDARLNQITARRVLSHTTGFPNWRAGGKPLRIYFAPGEKFSYSGEGFVYLQKAVEHLVAMPLDDFMKKTVFEPLGMTSSSYVWQEKYESLKAYAHDASGGVAGRSKPQEANAAATLHTTAFDYAKFVAAILNRRGIKDATVREMLRPQIKVDDTCTVCFEQATAGKLSTSIVWGLGWGLENSPNGNSFWHWGDNGNVKSYVVADDKSKTGVVFFANSAGGLSIAEEIVKQSGGGKQPALAWLKYEPYNSPSKTFLRAVLSDGVKATGDYRKRGKRTAAGETLDQAQMNWVGYQLLGKKRFDEAIEILKLNAETFPDSSNVYDSLGEAYLKSGETQLSIKNYRKAVELNPQNANAVNAVKQLESAQQVKTDAKLLETYAGEYETPFGVFKVVKEGEGLVGRVAGEADMILLPQSDAHFVVALGSIRLTFVKDEKGVVTHANISVKGQEISAKKIR